MSERRAVLSTAVAVGLAVGAYGISFGALAVAAGFDVLQACALSVLMFTGGSQFALVGVIASGGFAAGGAAILSAATLGFRNLVYGVRLSSVMHPTGVQRLAVPWLTIDESTAVALAQPTTALRRLGFWATGISVFVFWNLATLIGALLGSTLGDPTRWGLDAAAAAAFLALLWPRLVHRQAAAVAVAAALVATVLSPWLTPGMPVLLAALVGVLIGWRDWGASSGQQPELPDSESQTS